MTMLHLQLNDKRLQWLREQAERDQKPMEDVVLEIMDEKMTRAEEPSNNLLLMLADLADQFEPISQRTDVSENFDEIIGEMMADEIRNRHESNDGST